MTTQEKRDKLAKLKKALAIPGISAEEKAIYKEAIAKLEKEDKPKKVTKSKAKKTVKTSEPSKGKKTKGLDRFSPAEKVKAVAGMKREIKKVEKDYGNLSRNEVLEIAQNFQKNYRSFYSQMIDEASDNKNRLTPTPENLIRWMKDPAKFDLIGVDTYKKDNPTANLKIQRKIFWKRLKF